MTISDALRTEAFDRESDLPWVLLTIRHDASAEPIRVVNNRINVVSGGNTFAAFPFEIMLPDSSEDAPPRATLTIDNVSREIGQAVRLMRTAAEIDIQVVRQETPDIVEMEFLGMRLSNVRYDALKVEGELAFEDLSREPFPAPTFSPAEFPGLVR